MRLEIFEHLPQPVRHGVIVVIGPGHWEPLSPDNESVFWSHIGEWMKTRLFEVDPLPALFSEMRQYIDVHQGTVRISETGIEFVRRGIFFTSARA